jgi:hypothetical protein
MDDRKHRDLICRLVYHVDNNRRRFHEFACIFDQTRPPDVSQTGNCKPVNAVKNPPHQFGRGTRAILGNPIEDVVEIASSSLVDDNFTGRCVAAAAL